MINRLKHDYAEVNGVRLHYVTAGSGRLIVFLHGFPEFWYAWKNQLIEFGRDFQAVAPDMRGYNLSSKPGEVERYQARYLVEDVRLLAAHFGEGRFILAGHDWGGAIAWLFAAWHPDLLERLIIINAPHPAIFQQELRRNPAQQAASQYMFLLRSSVAEALLSARNCFALRRAVLRRGLKLGYFTEDDAKAYLEAWSQPGALTGALNYYRAARVGPSADLNSTGDGLGASPSSLVVRVPTLVIWGERDIYLRRESLKGLDQFVPRLTVKRVADGSHWVVHEKPSLVNAWIREFLGVQGS